MSRCGRQEFWFNQSRMNSFNFDRYTPMLAKRGLKNGSIDCHSLLSAKNAETISVVKVLQILGQPVKISIILLFDYYSLFPQKYRKKDQAFQQVPNEHLTNLLQKMWRQTKFVGCGIGRCGIMQIVVCHYYPPGNFNVRPLFDLRSLASLEEKENVHIKRCWKGWGKNWFQKLRNKIRLSELLLGLRVFSSEWITKCL